MQSNGLEIQLAVQVDSWNNILEHRDNPRCTLHRINYMASFQAFLRNLSSTATLLPVLLLTPQRKSRVPICRRIQHVANRNLYRVRFKILIRWRRLLASLTLLSALLCSTVTDWSWTPLGYPVARTLEVGCLSPASPVPQVGKGPVSLGSDRCIQSSTSAAHEFAKFNRPRHR